LAAATGWIGAGKLHATTRSTQRLASRNEEDRERETVTIVVIATRFDLGRVLTTPGAEQAMNEAGISYESLLSRHAAGDWGDLDEDDKRANDLALASGEDRIFSAYRLLTGETVWLITEADRSATTALLPSEY